MKGDGIKMAKKNCAITLNFVIQHNHLEFQFVFKFSNSNLKVIKFD